MEVGLLEVLQPALQSGRSHDERKTMTYKYEWSIVDLITQKSVGDLQDVVVQCAWSVCGQYIEKTGENSQNTWEHHFGEIQVLPAPQSDNFVSYDKLTQDQVLQWLWNGMVDKDEIENQLKQKLDESKSNNIGNAKLPWMT